MKKELYDLTTPQKSIWLTEQFYKGTSINNICGTLMIREKVDFDKLQEAINFFVHQNDAIRTKIILINGKPKQYIDSYNKFTCDILDIDFNELELTKQEVVNMPFELLNTKLFKFTIIRFPDQSGGFILNVSHIIGDAWSLGLLTNEIVCIYSQLQKNENIAISNKNSYIDYINSEMEYLNSNQYLNDETFWNSLYNKEPKIEFFQRKHFNNDSSSTVANRYKYILNKDFSEDIIKFCNNNKISPFILFMFALSFYFSKILNRKDVIFSSPVLNRRNFKEKNTFGMYISTIPFKVDINSNASFSENISEISNKQFKYFRHQKYPYMNLLENLRKNYNFKNNLYDTVISYQNIRTNHEHDDIKYSTDWVFNGHALNPLVINIYDFDSTNQLHLFYDYQADYFNETDMKDLNDRLLFIINQVMANPEILVKDIKLVNQIEEDEILYEFNKTSLDYDKSKTICGLFEDTVKDFPNKTAVVCMGNPITYNELNVQANQLADHLSKNYKLNKAPIAILMNRSIDLIVAIFAVLKSGCYYILIDPNLPKERINHMISHADCTNILTNLENYDYLDPSFNIINTNTLVLSNYSKENPNKKVVSSDIMYVLYTSGSTGTPKGVIITHMNVHNYFVGISQMIDYSIDKKLLSMTSISFDVFGFELYLSLLHGLTIFLATDEEQKDPYSLNKLIIDNHINILHTTPGKVNFMLNATNSKDSFKLLTDVAVGGEELTSTFLKRLVEYQDLDLYNLYGPTEATIACTYKKIDKNELNITIGKPLANVKIYVLNEDLQICPKYVKGDLYLSGDGIALGYYNDKALSDEAFINNKFLPGAKMYKTGDIASFNEDGELIFYGRNDFQIKIRGFRIELGEIESALLSHPFIKESVVIPSSANNRQFICAYYISDFKISSSELRKYLGDILPSYMIPSYFIQIYDIPLSNNDKIDKNSLPSPFECISDESYTPPENDVQKKICIAFENCLDVSNISIKENFLNLGIDSLTITKIQLLLTKENINIPIQYFYEYDNIKDLYDALQNTTNTSSNLIAETSPFKHNNLDIENITELPYSNVFLTGATGFLGIHILDSLLQKGANIYCFIRSSSIENAKKRLLSTINFYFKDKYCQKDIFEKVHVVLGDITHKNLNMSNEDFDLLGKKVDMVIHSAALTKYYGKFEEFDRFNITGTKNVVNFCVANNIPLSYISTISVSGDFLPINNGKLNHFTEDDLFIGQNYDKNYYIKSKLLAEKYILDTIRSHNLNANIYRIGNLTGRYSDGLFQYNIDKNYFYKRLKFILEHRIAYQKMLLMNLDISPVDCVSRALLGLIYNYKTDNKIFHVFNPKTYSFKELLEIFSKLGYTTEVLTDLEFEKKLYNNSDIFDTNILDEYYLTKDIENYDIKNDSTITLKYLNKIGQNWYPLDLNYFDKLISYMKKINFIGVECYEKKEKKLSIS